MTELRLSAVTTPRLGPLDLALEDGLYVVISADAGALSELCEVLSGVLPARGALLLDGVDVQRMPATRARIASLQANEVLLPAATVSDALTLASSALQSISAAAALSESGRERLAERAPEQLTNFDRRTIVLPLALGAHAAAFVLYDPLALSRAVPNERVVRRCRELSEGAVVIIATPSFADAAVFGGKLILLVNGQLWVPARRPSARPRDVDVIVRTQDAARLSEALTTHPELKVAFDSERSSEELLVRGPDLARTTELVLAAATQSGLSVSALSPAYSEASVFLSTRPELERCSTQKREGPQP